MPMPNNPQNEAPETLPPDAVSLLIGGKYHSTWTDYEIDSDLLIPADAWRVSLALPKGEFPEIVTPGAEVEIRIGQNTVMSGRVDDIEHQIDKESHTLRMSGRDHAAVLVDCSAPIFSSKKASLAEIISQVVKPLGIKKYRIDASSTATREKISVEPGDTAWSVLEQAAEANGLWPWFEPDGTLVVGGPDYNAPPVTHLMIKKDGTDNNIISLNYKKSIAGRYSETTLLGQSHGTGETTGKHALKAKVTDSDISIYRPQIVVDSDVDSGAAAQKRARKIQADARLNGLTITITVKGHHTAEGTLWQPGQRVQLTSEPHKLDAVYFLMSRRFEGGRYQGKITELTLVEDGVWILDAKPQKAEAKKGRKKRRKGRGKGNGSGTTKELVIVNVD